MHKTAAVVGLFVVMFITAVWFFGYTRRPMVKAFLFLGVIGLLQVLMGIATVLATFRPQLYLSWFVNSVWKLNAWFLVNIALAVLQAGGIAWLVSSFMQAMRKATVDKLAQPRKAEEAQPQIAP